MVILILQLLQFKSCFFREDGNDLLLSSFQKIHQCLKTACDVFLQPFPLACAGWIFHYFLVDLMTVPVAVVWTFSIYVRYLLKSDFKTETHYLANIVPY